jgi:hypothetical protein
MNMRKTAALVGIALFACATDKPGERAESAIPDSSRITAQMPEDTLVRAASIQAETIVTSWREQANSVDKAMTTPNNGVRLYVQTPAGVSEVSDPDALPESMEAMYGVLPSDKGGVVAVFEVPVSGTEDWTAIYTHYFDTTGRTVAFRRVSRFFNGSCAEVLQERSTYFYDGAFQLLAKDYDIVDGDERAIDPRNCDFPYRQEYKIHRNWREFSSAVGLR